MLVTNRFNWSTVPLSGGRASVSRSATDAVPLFSESMAVPIGSLSAASAVTNVSSLAIVAENLSPSLVRVASSVRRLSISAWMVWLCSASAVVNPEVLENRDCSAPPLPLKDLDQRSRQSVDILRIKPADNGFEPTEQQIEV